MRVEIAIFVIVLVVQTVNSIEIYVSRNDGSDLNDGLSEKSPVETLRKASDTVSTFQGDVSIFLARNSTWIEDSLDVGSTTGSITITAYGDESMPRPLIQHPRHAFAESFCIRMTLSNHSFLVSHIHMSACSNGLVLIPYANGIIPTDGIVQSNLFTDIKTPFLKYQPPNPAWATAIVLSQGKFQNLTVRNNIGARLDVFFSSTAYVSGMNLDSNTVQFCQGNCYSVGLGEQIILQNSVFLNDFGKLALSLSLYDIFYIHTPHTQVVDFSCRYFSLFMSVFARSHIHTHAHRYGVTDVIIGGLQDGQIVNNDFNARGEYIGGPDGCAIDFETSASGTKIEGNTISKSYGGGVMIFGHDTTSQNISISENIFDRCGCVQNRNDRGGIAVMCPGGHQPSGKLHDNTFLLCSDNLTPAIFSPNSDPKCTSNLDIQNTTTQPYSSDVMVEMPQLSLNPPSPDSQDTKGTYQVLGVTKTSGATVHYTLDGSRPTENCPVIPEKGLNLQWPSAAIQVNLRAFKAGMIPSITNGALIELNYVLGREAPHAAERGPGGAIFMGLESSLDGVNVLDSTSLRVNGWVVDQNNGGRGREPVVLSLYVDFSMVQVGIASEPRPDLVKAGVAPDPNHGFDITLKSLQLLSSGRHVLEILSIGSKSASSYLVGRVVCVDGTCNSTTT